MMNSPFNYFVYLLLTNTFAVFTLTSIGGEVICSVICEQIFQLLFVRPYWWIMDEITESGLYVQLPYLCRSDLGWQSSDHPIMNTCLLLFLHRSSWHFCNFMAFLQFYFIFFVCVYCVCVWATLPDLNKLDWIGLDFMRLMPGFHHSVAVSPLPLRKFRKRCKNYVAYVKKFHCAVAVPAAVAP